METVPPAARRRRTGPVWSPRQDGAAPHHDVHSTTRTPSPGLPPPSRRHPPARAVDRQPRLVGCRAGTMSTSPTVAHPRDPRATNKTEQGHRTARSIRLVSRTQAALKTLAWRVTPCSASAVRSASACNRTGGRSRRRSACPAHKAAARSHRLRRRSRRRRDLGNAPSPAACRSAGVGRMRWPASRPAANERGRRLAPGDVVGESTEPRG